MNTKNNSGPAAGDVLGRAIGRSLAMTGGLRAAYLPDGVDKAVAVAIVQEANRNRNSTPAFAVLVSDEPFIPAEADETLPVVWPPADVIKYRQGDRLVVIPDGYTDLQSVSTSFVEALGLSYPKLANGVASIDKVARQAIAVILESVDGPTGGQHLPEFVSVASERLSSCLEQLRDIYEESRRGDTAWNSQWFFHASSGLNRLREVIRHKSISTPSSKLSDLFSRYTFASFSLPNPDSSNRLSDGNVGREFAAAVDEFWIDEDRVSASARQLAHHPDTRLDTHPLSNIEWKGFDRSVADVGGPLLGLLRAGLPILEVVEAFVELTPSQFLNPTSVTKDLRKLVVCGIDDEDYSVSENRSSGPYLISSDAIEDGLFESEKIRVRIPTLARPSAESVAGSSLTIKVSPAAFTWDGSLEIGVSGDLWAIGTVTREYKKASKPFLPAALSVEIPADDALAHLVHRDSSCAIHLLPGVGVGVLYYKYANGRITGRPVGVGPTSIGDVEAALSAGDSLTHSNTYPDARYSYRVVVWTNDNADAASFNGKPLEPFKHRARVFSATLTPGSVDVFEVANQRFELSAPEPTGTVHSPIVAAITRQVVTAVRPGEGTTESVRGILEQHYAASLVSGDWAGTMGHLVIPADREEIPLAGFEGSATDSGFAMNQGTREIWSVLSNDEVPAELLESVEAADFRDAFAALGTTAAMTREGGASAEHLEWPSRTSWRHLWHTGRELNRYLECYTKLIEKANEIGSPYGVFWATYPFSASLWNTNNSLECVGVLLSPLHPIRLAWLASVESTLWESEAAAQLAGTIEGWNFPALGPRNSSIGQMVAIPMDSGEGQVFLGWSMLVAASIEEEKPLLAPSRIGRFPAPGTAASGLNATAATSALRSYRRMHPHVSTLTIDLAASTPTSRLEEVDSAVLAQLNSWAIEKGDRFRGGARVLDSLRRGGEVPSAVVTRLARANSQMPVLWSRYEPNVKLSQACNIRLLQDSGVQVRVELGKGSNHGVVGYVPLRRFQATAPPEIGAKRALTRPALHAGSKGWNAFGGALQAAERGSSIPQISSRLHQSALIDNRADWTVSGESLLSPGAMAALVGGGSQMLWEWRPPFLEPEPGVPLLERRPFVSVARVPFGFRSRLASVLAKVTGQPAEETEVGELLGKLGARGVGLSSLLAIGGTQVSGALGFYLAFSLTEFSDDSNGVDQFVLPIDACDTFLKALAGTDKHADRTQRADLLVIRLDGEQLSFIPVEIKFYGSDGAGFGGHLPKLNDGALTEAIKQLSSTTNLLQTIEARQYELNKGTSEDEAHLWRNALATLVEAGIRLKPAGSAQTEGLPQRLQGVVDGTIPLRVGKSIITYFKHGAETSEGRLFDTFEGATAEGFEYAAITANSKHAFESIKRPSSSLTSEWRALVEWASSPLPALTTEEPTGQTGREAAGSELEEVQIAAGPDPSRREPELLDAAFVEVVEGQPKTMMAIPMPPEQEQEQKQEQEPEPEPEPEPKPEPELKLDPGPGPERLAAPEQDGNNIQNEGIRFVVGDLADSAGHASADFWPGNTALNQMNIGVVGDLGTGKTQLLKTLISELRASAKVTQENPLSLLVFDYKRDFQDQEFLTTVGGEVLHPQRIPLNIFALENGYSALAAFQKASAFCDVLSKIYANVGPVQKDRLITIITDLFKEGDGEPPLLSEVRERYVDQSKPDAVTGILNTFVLGEIFSEERSDLLSFDELIHDKVLIVALSDLGADQNSKNSLVAFFLNLYYDYMRRSQKWPFDGNEPQIRRLNSFLLVDEAVNIMRYSFDVLMDLMLQGREFGFGTILASQYLSHFKTGGGPNYGEPLLTWFIHKVPNVTAKQLEALGIPGATAESAERISRQKVHEAYYSSLGFSGRFMKGIPFYLLHKK